VSEESAFVSATHVWKQILPPDAEVVGGFEMKLVLASSSPRRQELLQRAGFEFEVRPSGAEEVRRSGESAEDFACRAAREKALAVAASSPPGSLVLGADTVVVTGDLILGKPSDRNDAARMLRMLSGASHRVVTGVCLVSAPAQIEAVAHETTMVTFRDLEEGEIGDYVGSGEPLDKAGAYAIQGLGSRFVTRIEGCYFNVVGLPIPLLYEMLKPFLRLNY
jgi:septum formation protein